MDPEPDIVGDRHRFVSIGMAAVFLACVAFAVLRFIDDVAKGRLTPWWVNVGGALVMAVAFLWYRREPRRRADVAVHLTAVTALVALMVPVAYGMSSSIWWIALVGFAVLLMGHRLEGRVWAFVSIAVVLGLSLAEPVIQLPGAEPEPRGEIIAARVGFLLVLLAVAAAFRAEANRRARALAAAAEALERANEVKSRFLAHMSHEVRTPLHGVIASTSMALEEPLTPQARTHLEASQQAAGALLRLLSRLLDYTRAEADGLEPRRTTFDLHALIAQTLAPLAAQAQIRGLSFEARAAPGLACERIGDGTRTAQIVSNLVHNAIKYTERGAVRVRMSQGDDSEIVILEVEDTGCGIPPDRVDQIFEPFTQLDNPDRARFGGAGLGLAIVREILRIMGGHISVRSAPGAGSTFTVTLPLPATQASPIGPTELLPAPVPAPARPSPASIRPLRVLVAEDHPTNQLVVEQMLKRTGHTVKMVDDGAEAWRVIESGEAFDLLLTDIEMPGLSGTELAARVREREALIGAPRLPIVGVTAHVGEDERFRLLELGMDEHLSKPFTPADLAAVLVKVLPDAAAPPSSGARVASVRSMW